MIKLQFIISPSKKKKHYFLISPPYCAPLLSRPEPRALRVHQRCKDSKQCLVSLSPSFPPRPPLTPKEAPPSGLRALLLKQRLPEASDTLPRGYQTNPHSATQLDGFQPRAIASPSPMRKNQKWVTYNFPIDHQLSLQGKPGWSLGKSPSGYHLPLGPPPEFDVKLYKASVNQSPGQVRTHEAPPVRLQL